MLDLYFIKANPILCLGPMSGSFIKEHQSWISHHSLHKILNKSLFFIILFDIFYHLQNISLKICLSYSSLLLVCWFHIMKFPFSPRQQSQLRLVVEPMSSAGISAEGLYLSVFHRWVFSCKQCYQIPIQTM